MTFISQWLEYPHICIECNENGYTYQEFISAKRIGMSEKTSPVKELNGNSDGRNDVNFNQEYVLADVVENEFIADDFCHEDNSTLENMSINSSMEEPDIIECSNCKRRNYEKISSYEISFSLYPRNQLKQRKKFRFVTCSRLSIELVSLCSECAKYLLNEDGLSYANMWPSFLWYFLSNEEVHQLYGNQKWKFIPDSLLLGWYHIYQQEVQQREYASFFTDVTMDKSNFDIGTRNPLLSKVAETCNKYLIPTILCPWGCSEYLHRSGKLPIDIILQRFVSKVNLILIHDTDDCVKVFSARDDFIREDPSDYDNILLNPKWKVCPKWCFTDEGPFILTCGDHDRGTRKKYIHLARNPFGHNLPSSFGDQLCHVVLKPRLIKPMKASKYSNTYQMHEQKGCFHGIDTCSLTTVGDFSVRDPIIDEQEALSICNRADIIALLTKLERNKIICSGKAEDMKVDAFEKMKNLDISNYICGSTYISIEDAVYLQKNLNEVNLMKVRSWRNQIIQCKRNWVQQIIYSQKMDKWKYGAQFPVIGPLKNNNGSNTLCLWMLARMALSVKELWKLIDAKQKNVRSWDGWFLTYFSRECFKEETLRDTSSCPFKYSYVNSLKKLLNKFNNLNERYETVSDIFNLLSGIQDVTVLHLRNILNTGEFLASRKDITVIVNTNINSDDEMLENVNFEYISNLLHSTHHELCFIGCFNVDDDTNRKDAECYFRHGGIYTSWWKVERYLKLPIHCLEVKQAFNMRELQFLVYVKKRNTEIESIRNSMLQYMGGQAHVICGVHRIPLIVQKISNKNCCADYSCNNQVFYGCPNVECNVCICKTCFHEVQKDKSSNIEIYPIEEYCNYVNDNNDDIDTVISQHFSSASLDSFSLDNTKSTSTIDNIDDLSSIDSSFIDDESVSSDKFMIHIDDYNEDQELGENLDTIPTTNTGDQAFNHIKQGRGEVIDGHVILNQCGSILCRSDSHINSYRTQKHFLQRMASTIDKQCVPLLYPEAMMFPSIFWQLHNDSGSFPGALPSSFLASKVSSSGFASIKSHINVRLTNQYSSSSSNPSYITFLFDILSNFLLNSVDSRIIIARGLTCEDGNIGIRVKSRKETNLHDSIDSKQMVKNLCASQKYLPMHFFLTFTVNQLEHFGVKNIKEWIDGYEWTSYFDGFEDFTLKERTYLKKSMDQAAAPLLLRNWMETIIFMQVLSHHMHLLMQFSQEMNIKKIKAIYPIYT